MQVSVSDIINALPDDKICHMTAEGDRLAIQIEDRDPKLKELTEDPDKFHILMMATRPGVHEFQTHLEHEYFDPNNHELNDLMQFRVIKWGGLLWNMISIPISMKQTAYDTAEKVKMRFEEKVIPFMTGGIAKVLVANDNTDMMAGWDCFPITDADRVVHLINEKNSEIYEHPLGSKDAAISENARVRYYMKSKGISDEELDQPLICEVPVEDDYDPWSDA